MATELITFNHLSCYSSPTALETRVIIELTVNVNEREIKRERYR